MKRMVVMLTLTLVVGIVVGIVGSQLLNAGQAQVRVTEMTKSDLAGVPGKEASAYLIEVAPGAAVGKHYHPGDAFGYVLEGSMILEVAGQPPVTLKRGAMGHVGPRQVHDDKNASRTSRLRLLVFHLADKGQPLAVPAQ